MFLKVRLYLSPRLSLNGQRDYKDLLKTAIESNDAVWLATNLRSYERINKTEHRQKPSNGGAMTVRIPENAADTLAEGEFNRFYIRGLCCRAIVNNIRELIIYRAKEVSNPRSASTTKIGRKINAEILLNDLRTHPGVDTAHGLPAEPNSGW